MSDENPFDFMNAQDSIRARYGLERAFVSGVTPEDQARRNADARLLGVPQDMGDLITPEQVAAKKAETIDWAADYATHSAFQRRLGSVQFANLVKDDVTNAGRLESLWWKISGTPGKPGDNDILKQARNSLARGGYGLDDTLPIFGNISRMTDINQRLTDIDNTEKRIAAGESDAVIFGTKDDPSGLVGRRVFDKSAAEEKARLESELKRLSESAAWSQRMTALYPDANIVQEFQKAEGFGESVAAFLSHPLMNMAAVAPQSAVQYAPAIPAIAALGLAGVPTVAAMAATGAYSYGMDKQSTIESGLGDLKVDATDPKAIYDFFRKPSNGELKKLVDKAELHALPVATFDALSAGMAKWLRLPEKSPEWMTKVSPTASRVYEKAFATPFRAKLNQLALQTNVQGLMGGAGEASGQLMSEGKISSWSDVVAEFAGEFANAPMEVATMSVKALGKARADTARAEEVTQAIMDLAKVAQKSKLLERDPQTGIEYLAEAAQGGGGDGMIRISVQSFHQDEAESLKQKLAEVSPSAREQMKEAEATGGEIKIPYSEFVDKVARSDIGEKVAQYSHVEGQPSLAEAREAERAILKGTQTSVDAALESRPPEFKDQVKQIGKGLEDAMKAGGMSASESHAYTALVQTLVANMAADAGVTPNEIWEKHGLRGVLFEGKDVARDAAGAKAVSPAAKALLGGESGSLPQNGRASASKGEFFPEAKTMVLWASHDRSTFLHETGHWFLGARMALAQSLKASGEKLTERQKYLVDTMDWTASWLGYEDIKEFVNTPLEGRREAEEKFARTFEQYLKDGFAPTTALQSLFRKFSSWLRGIYGILAAVSGSEMNQSTKQLFDRLFISSEQQTEARLTFNLYQALTREDFNDEEAYRAYESLVRDSIDAANEQLTAKGMRDLKFIVGLKNRILKDMNDHAKQIFKNLVDEEKKAYEESAAYKAYLLMSRGEMRNGKKHMPRLSYKDVEKLGLSKEEIEKLHGLRLVERKDGKSEVLPGEALAKECGYDSLDKMVRELLGIRKPDEVAEERAKDRMLKEYGEFSSEKQMELAAAKAVYNPATARMLAAEATFLDKSTAKRISIPVFRKVAEFAIGRVVYGNLNPADERRAAAILGRESKQYQTGFSDKHTRILEGGKKEVTTEKIPRDPAKAAELKRKQLYQEIRAEEAQRVKDDIKKRIAALKKIARKKDGAGYEGAYLEQLRSLLWEWGFNGKDNFTPREDFAHFVQGASEIPGAEVPFPGEGALEATRKPLKERTINEVLDQLTYLEDLASAGKRANEYRVNGRLETFKGIDQKLSAEVEANAKKRGLAVKDNLELEGRKAHIKDAIKKIGLVHARIPDLLAAISGGRFGAMFDAVTRQFDAAADREIAMKNKAAVALAKAYAPADKATKDHKAKYYKPLNISISKSQVFNMLLNLGNAENEQRLLDGSVVYSFNTSGKAFTREQVLKLVTDVLSPEEIQAAQGIWDTMSMFSDDLQRLEKRVGHRPMKLTQPKEVKLPNGITLKGGYYPITYDRKASSIGAANEAYDAGLKAAAAARGRSTPDASHTKGRSRKVVEPVTLTSRAGFEAMDAIIHDIAWREVLMDASRIFSPKTELAKSIKKYWGAESLDAIHDWIKDIAANGRGNSAPADAIANFLRSNVSLAGIGLNLVTAILQLIGATQTIAVLGPKWSTEGAVSFFAHPRRSFREITEKSPMMADRMRTRFREVAEIQARAVGNVGSVKDKFQRVAYLPVIAMQMLVDFPTWQGAYAKALAEGNTEERARAMADRIVVDAQGSGRLMDLSGVERGNAWSKLLTVFYTFFNTAYNIAQLSGRTESKMRAAFTMLMVFVLQPVLETFMREGISAAMSDDDDDEWLSKTLRKAVGNTVGFGLGTIVGLREISDIAASAVGGDPIFGYSGPAGLRKIVDASRLIQQISQGEMDEGLMKAVVSVAGENLGFPVTPVNRLISGASALEEGETDNPLVLILGYSKY